MKRTFIDLSMQSSEVLAESNWKDEKGQERLQESCEKLVSKGGDLKNKVPV